MINFIQDENGNWVNTEARLAQPNTIFSIDIQKVTSRFNHDLPPKYYVVLDYTSERGYHNDVTIKSFERLKDAQKFANKLAHLLNGDD